MNGLVILIPAALFLGLLGLVAFLWSLRSGQFDDLDGAAVRILGDDSEPAGNKAGQSEKATPGPGTPTVADVPSENGVTGGR